MSLIFSKLTEANKKHFLGFIGVDPAEFLAAQSEVPAKVATAVQRIKNMPFAIESTYVGHSGGKDSVLVRYLADLAIDYLPTVHSTKPEGVPNEVHPLTREFLYEQPRVITYSPLDLMPSLGYKTQIDGTRIAEHDRSNGRAVDVVIDGKQVSRKELPLYLENGLFGLNFVYPIYDWSDAEVWAAIAHYDIPFSEEYLYG